MPDIPVPCQSYSTTKKSTSVDRTLCTYVAVNRSDSAQVSAWPLPSTSNGVLSFCAAAHPAHSPATTTTAPIPMPRLLHMVHPSQGSAHRRPGV